MRGRKRWLVLPMPAAAMLAWARYRRGGLGRMAKNVHRFSAPTARVYDAMTAYLLGRFFSRVAHRALPPESAPSG